MARLAAAFRNFLTRVGVGASAHPYIGCLTNDEIDQRLKHP